ncbi:MAG TPA: DUF748 domain-containing protein [Chitinispirillaceae bacterium]|jgi:hypothetical protein|nr:DUF748 domain-containing protein [Chitinispirillaceae bacterium]
MKNSLKALPLRFWIITAVFLLLVSLRIALPFAAKWYLNSSLQNSADYTGKIDKINMNLIRGAYTISGISLNLKSGDTAISFISAEAINFIVNWGSLFSGKLIARGEIRVPEMDYIIGVTQVPQGKPFAKLFSDLFPVRIDLLILSDAKIRVKNTTTNPQYELYMTDIDASIVNLTNSRKISEDLYASMKLRGNFMESGVFEMAMSFNPVSVKPVFNLNATMTELVLTELNEAARAHAGITFEKGIFAARSKLTTERNTITGFIKPVFVNLQVFSADEEDLLKKFRDAITGATSEIIEGPGDRISATIPVTIPLKPSDSDYFSIVTGALITSFGKAIIPEI